ncbi:hypothetical protein C0989_006664 [Termitomyces sp. Mn162]|nr:hypothetical protein C0989_006664 [Termitomyces sp. Mn162]
MTQPTASAPPSDASSPQDDAISGDTCSTDPSLSYFHTAELTGLCQTTEAVSLSFKALLEHLPLTPTPTSGPLAAAGRFSSALSLEPLAPHSKLSHPALLNVFDGDCKVGEDCCLEALTSIGTPWGREYKGGQHEMEWEELHLLMWLLKQA